MKFSIKDFFSKCDQIRSFLRIWSHLLKKSLIENFICAVNLTGNQIILVILQNNLRMPELKISLTFSCFIMLGFKRPTIVPTCSFQCSLYTSPNKKKPTVKFSVPVPISLRCHTRNSFILIYNTNIFCRV